MLTPDHLAEIEALCAAAHDVREDNRRLVGLPAPTVRELIGIARAVQEMGYARRNPKLSRHAIAAIEKRVVDIAYELSANTDRGEG